MRRWDRRAIREEGVPEQVLMENAGRLAARVVHRLYPRGPVAVAVGRGNNGGDAWVVLRTLRAWGREVRAVPVGEAEVSGELLHGWGVEVVRGEEEAARAFRESAVIVDGILGTGARGAPRPPQAAAIRAINGSGAPVVALDGPSGVDLTTGAVAGEAVRAEATVTFGAPKRGLLLFPGRRLAGRILTGEVGFPPLREGEWRAQVVTPAWARTHTPEVPPDAHKGTLGTVTVVAGERGVAGAALLAGRGAARGGAGKIMLASPEENRVILQSGLPEALFVSRDDESLPQVLEGSGSVVAGPGMGTGPRALNLLRTVLERGEAHLVLDADAITLLARNPEILEGARHRSVLLTPHPGEMGRLMGEETGTIVADPFQHAREAAERFDCGVLLKGAPSVVAAPGAPTLVNVSGHSGVATGGMGDTLAGIAAAFAAAGAPVREAGALALFYSGRAAEIAGRGRSLLPGDVAEALPEALAEGEPPPSERFPDLLLDLPAPR